MKSFKLLMVILCSLNLSYLNAQGEKIDYQFPDIVVTSSRTPISFSDLTRNVQIIDSEEIKNIPVTNIQDLLQYAAGVDVKQRGVEGIQADVSIRGGTFEQTLVLIDGIKLSDPQTGHHNMNIPVTLDNVERIEILKGQGSKIFGPNAFSGVINIITKKESKRSLSFQLLGGQHGFYKTGINGSYPVGIFNNQISFSRKNSDGYTHNTDFEMINFSYSPSLNFGDDKINLFFGYNDKKFGANSFYTSMFPNQWEHTTTRFASISGEINSGSFSIIPKAYFRRHDDNFLLDYTNPSFYENNHKTNVYGFEFQSSLKTNLGTTSLGGEFVKDKIESNNLGKHERESKGIFAEHNFSPFKNFIIIIGAFAYDYSTIGWKYWPGFDFAYKIISNARLYGSVGKAFRVPTYTDLYYSDPASKGNKNLRHEETLNYEIGFNYSELSYQFNISLFRKEGKNIIDWARDLSDGRWLAQNIAEINTNGVELNFAINPNVFLSFLPIYNLAVNYTYLNTDRELGIIESRYLLDHLENQSIVTLNNYLFFDIKQGWVFRYEDRVNYEDHFLVDTQLLYDFQLAEVFIKATNLFNKSYRDFTGITLPGRWIIAGAKVKVLF